MTAVTTLAAPTIPAEVTHAVSATVSSILRDRGLPVVSAVDSRPLLGRNRSWLMELESGARVFVKQIDPAVAGPSAFRRSVAYGQFARENQDHAPSSPQLLGYSETDGLLIFEECPGTNAATLLAQEQLPSDFPMRAGELLAQLHGGRVTDLPDAQPPSPPHLMLAAGIPAHRFFDFTIAEISLWHKLQADVPLIAAAQHLRELEAAHRYAPTHNDVRLDQFHVQGHELSLVDWEEFGYGDPARDLGALAGELIYRAVLDTVTTRGSGDFVPPSEFDSHLATTLIAQRIESVVPQVKALWLTYRLHSERTDRELSVRATAHAGWHLVDRTIARAPLVSRLPGIERAAAGIGRRALLSPERFAQLLGFGGE